MRAGTASTLTRAEVRGGGKKPYKQKGTGSARRGSSRSPLFPGGGVVFGPKPKDWSIEMNKKERRLAMATALQSAAADMIGIESFAPVEEAPRTKALVDTCRGVGADPMEEYVLVVTRGANAAVARAGKNIQRLKVNSDESLKVYDVLRADKIIVEAPALDTITKKYTKLSQDRSSKHGLKKGFTRGSYKDLLAIKAGYTGGKQKPDMGRKGGGSGGSAATESAPVEEAKGDGEAAE